MDLTSQVLFFLGALGVFNALIVSFYFIISKRDKRKTNLFFGVFLFMLCFRIIKSIFYYFNTDEVRFLLKTGYIACIFIGPFLYFYIKSRYESNSSINKNWKYHIAIWLPVNVLIHFFYPFKTNVALWKSYILNFIDLQWLIYLVAAGFVLQNVIRKKFRKEGKITVVELWLSSLLFATLLVWVVFFFTDYQHFIAGSIIFSLLFYLFLSFFLFDKKKVSLIFNREQKYANKKIEASKVAALINKLEVIMREQKIFKNTNLKSADLAKQLDITTHQLSQLLNDNLSKSFSLFINEYRVEEAKKILKTNSIYTLEAIGKESGFNSKSTFFTTFKKIVGMTPAKYKNQL